jgi:putative transposase
MYAIEQELQLKDRERTLMARHSGDVRFCYNWALALDREVKGHRISSSKKVATTARVFTTHIKKLPEERWTKTRSSRVDKMTFGHFGEILSRFFKVLGGRHKLKRKKDGDSINVENVGGERKILSEDSPSINIPLFTSSARELAAAISDCGFSEVRRPLVYKSSMYGTTVELVDRWYPPSKTSSNCGRVRSVPLNERVFECEHCCAIIHRGIQVAIDSARHELARKAGQVRSVKPADKKEPTPLQAAVREP